MSQSDDVPPDADAAEYSKPQVSVLLQLLTEATRATPQGGPTVYVPPAGSELASAKYHHFVFGQRGSGKSSLLRHLQNEMEISKRGAVWIDQEIFSALKYPDVLVSAVLETTEQLKTALPEAQMPGFWRRLFSKQKPDPLHLQMNQMIQNLRTLKTSPDNREIQWTHTSNSADELGRVDLGAA